MNNRMIKFTITKIPAGIVIITSVFFSSVSLQGRDISPMNMHLAFTWNPGSIPPPDYYEYTILIGPGQRAEIRFRPDYPDSDPPVWIERFSVSEDIKQNLLELIRSMPSTEAGHSVWVGGGLATLSLQGPHTEPQLISLQAQNAQKAVDRVRDLVPENIWKTLFENFDAYRHARR